MGKVGKFIAGGILILGGLAVGVFTGNWQLALSMASIGVGIITRPKIPQDLGRQQGAVLQTRVGTQNALPVIYGTTQVAGAYVDVRVDSLSSQRKRLTIVVAWAHGSRDGGGIQAIDEIWFDDRLAISGSTVQAPFNGAVTGQGVNHLEFRHYLGSTTQVVDTLLNSRFPSPWPPTSKGAGIAYSVFDLWFNPDIYGSGLPSTIQAKVRGARVYDPRDSTWKHSNNPALCIRDYLLSPIYGQNVPENRNMLLNPSAEEATTAPWIVGGGTLTRDTGEKKFGAASFKFVIPTSPTAGYFYQNIPLGGVLNAGRKVFLSFWAKAASAGTFASNTAADGPCYIEEQGGAFRHLTSDVTGALPLVWTRYTVFGVLPADVLPTANIILRGGRNGATPVNVFYDGVMVGYGDWVPDFGYDYLEEQTFIDMANYCDEVVNVPGLGSVARYVLDGWVDTGQDVPENLARLCTSCRGNVVNEGDRWRMYIRRQRSPSGFVVSEHNTVEGSWSWNVAGAQCPNVVRATYVDPAQKYQTDTVQWPAAGQTNFYLGDDNNFESRMEVDLPYTPNRGRAQQMAMTLLKEARQSIVVKCTLLEDALVMRTGDLVGVTQPTPGWNEKLFDVMAMLLLPDGQVGAVLVNYSAAVYDLDTQPTPPTAPNTDLPNPFVVAVPTGLGLDGSVTQAIVTTDGTYVPRIKVTWFPPADAFVEYIEVQAKTPGASNFDSWGRVAESATAEFFISPASSGTWTVRIRAVNRLGRQSDWVELTVAVSDRPPQILTLTSAGAHIDVSHQDVAHQDSAHGDSAHGDSHSDVTHADTHTDVAHSDAAHVDSHGDIGAIDTDHTDTHDDSPHSDNAHVDSHSDSHTDSHTDAAHSDSQHADAHTDASHGDGNYGIGVSIQADASSASVKAAARRGGANLLTNGGFETGSIGAQATGWTVNSGNNLNCANDSVKLGLQAGKIINAGVTDSSSRQDVTVVPGRVYRIQGWIKTDALPTGDAGFGAVLNVDIQAGGGTFTIISKTTIGADPNAGTPDCGVQASGSAVAYSYVSCVFSCTSATTLRIHCQLGFGGGQSGTAWFDDVWLQEVFGTTTGEPDLTDIRSQPATDGRNVVIPVIDVATGSALVLEPGETGYIAALAYSQTGGLGIEGPIARARQDRFTVAPVGTDKWVPS